MPDLHFSANLPLTATRAYEAFSHTELLTLWLAASPKELCALSLDFVEGGSFSIQLQNMEAKTIICEGEFARLRAKEQIAFSMHIQGMEREVGETSVDIRFSAQDDGVHLVVHHEGITSTQMADTLAIWWEQAISRLGLLVST